MRSMLVTLDVSQLSGWLNAAAFCRVRKRACGAGRGAGREVRGRVLGQRWRKRGAHAEGPTEGRGPVQAERTKNMRSMVITLEKTKLSGWLNADACCRVERRAHGAGLGVGQEV